MQFEDKAEEALHRVSNAHIILKKVRVMENRKGMACRLSPSE